MREGKQANAGDGNEERQVEHKPSNREQIDEVERKRDGQVSERDEIGARHEVGEQKRRGKSSAVRDTPSSFVLFYFIYLF